MEGKIKFEWKNVRIFLGLGLIFIVGFLFLTIKDKGEDPKGGEQVQDMKIEDTKVGEREAAKEGDTVTVDYKGTLENGDVFDSSYDRGEPFSFTIGEGSVIEGWEKGVSGMKVGGKRKLTIPPEMGYGDRQAGSIPPNSTLIFEIELLKIE